MFQGVGGAEKMAEAALAALLSLVSQAVRGFGGGTQGLWHRGEGTLTTDCLVLRERSESKGKRALQPAGGIARDRDRDWDRDRDTGLLGGPSPRTV